MGSLRTIVGACALLLLAACGAGGGGSTLPPTAVSGAPSPVGPAPSGSQSVAVSIAIPRGASSAGNVRKPQYVSSQTQSAAVAVNGGTPQVVKLVAGAPGCIATSSALTCTLTLTAPLGSDTFTVALYASLDGTGTPLSTGAATDTIVAGTVNTVALTLSGVVSSIALALNPSSPAAGTATSVALDVTVKDAGGAAIVGADPFATPIVLTDSDTSGATRLSKTQLNSPADLTNLTLSYSGATLSGATIGARAGGVTATPVTLTPQGSSARPVFNDYVTYGYDNARDVYNPNSTAITPASLSSLHLAWQSVLNAPNGDYNTQSQPILATEISGHSGVLFVGSGGSGNVYAFDATSGASLWKHATGIEQFTCQGGFNANFGSGGSAAYDPATRSLYIVGNTNGGYNALATNTLYHLDAATGNVLNKADFATPDTNWPSLDFSHVSVTLANGIAYVGTGATCDIPSWRGRIVAINTATMQVARTFFPLWAGTQAPYSGGGIWGWGGVSIDPQGNVLAGIGNATTNLFSNNGTIAAPFQYAPAETSGYADGIVKLPPGVGSPLEYNQPMPASIFHGGSVDLDLNGTPAIVTPNGAGCDPVAAIQGKSGTLYLYDELRLGDGPSAQFDLSESSYEDGFLGSPAYSPATGLLYANSTSSQTGSATGGMFPPGLVAISVGCNSTPQVLWHSSFGPDAYVGATQGVPRSVPAVSAGGVVFVGTTCASDGNGNCTGSVAPSPTLAARSSAAGIRRPLVCCSPPNNNNGALWAVDASTGRVLNNGAPIVITSGPLRAPVTIDGDWVYAMDMNGNLYGFTTDASFPAIQSTVRRTDARIFTPWENRPRAN